jgi:hypothetical protein
MIAPFVYAESVYYGDNQMTKRKYILAMLIANLVLLVSCVSPSMKSLINEEIPKFSGVITPVTILIQPEYKPLRGKVIATSVVNANLILKGSEVKKYSILESEITMTSIADIKKIGDMLTWNLKTYEITENNQSRKVNIPYFDVTLLTDKYGEVKEFECLAPYFEQPSIRSKMGETKLEEIKSEMKKSFQFSRPLTRTPIITGSVIFELPLKSALHEIIQESPLLSQYEDVLLKVPETIGSKVQGWAYFEGRKVLVVITDFAYNETSKKGDVKFNALLSGYTLLDPEKFVPIYMNSLFKVTFSDIRGVTLKALWEGANRGKLPDIINSGELTEKAINIMSFTSDK